ncbi:MAG: phenylalanine--tRNA ligase subunit beta [Shimia sp.]
MKFTLSWLEEHLDTQAPLADILEALTDLGLEVEEVSDPADRLGAFTIGKVVAAEKHPDADRLKVCQVEIDPGAPPTQIICGAPNAREGITVVIARPGTYVPGIDTTIGVGKIRGVESHGMMCSEREMELSDEHDGIIELPSGEVGQPFVDWLAAHDPAKVDPVVEIAITPNRPDALGVRGIARDLAARGLGTLKPLTIEPVPGAFPCPIGVAIDDDTRDACPVFHGRLIRGVTNGPSPDWLQRRLTAIGLRPISFLVDVTNFFTFDLNRPLHVFDAAKVQGDLRIHRAAGGETLLGLDDKTHTLPEGAVAISDDTGLESLGGVMGGAATGVSEATTDVFLEAAYFDPVRTAYTGRALKLNTDARYRFERGIDPESVAWGMEAATRMILDHAGGEASEVVVAGAIPDTRRAYRLDTDRVQSLVGMEIAGDDQRDTLCALGFEQTTDEGFLGLLAGYVTGEEYWQPPTWRPDVTGEADLVEEVARIASLTKLVSQPLTRPTGVPRAITTPAQDRERAARRMAAALGYDECVSYSFIDAAAAKLFGGTEALALENPISQDMSHLRPDLLPGLLQAAARNQARGVADLALFEVGPAFTGGGVGAQETQVAGLAIGHTAPRDVHGERRAVDVFDAKADVEAVLGALGAPARAQIRRDAAAWFHPGRSGVLALGKARLATFGEVHPRVLAALGVKGPAVAFTIWPDAVPAKRAKTTARPALALSDLQAVERDFAFLVDAQVEAITLVNAAQGADKALIDEVRVFDEFVGGSLGEGRKSIALTVRLQPRDKTLTEGDIEAVSQKIVGKVTKATGGALRG